MRSLTAEEIWCAANGGATQPTDLDLLGLPRRDTTATGTGWLQLGLSPATQRRRELYRAAWDLVGELDGAGALGDFFFMHKPPGMRLRLRSGDGDLEFIRHIVKLRIAHWESTGILGRREYGVYEPEYLLFGGPVSMRSVHRVFTADSRLWLPLHATGQDAGPPWAIALLTTRALLGALRVEGWERLDVADRLRRQTGRGPSPALLAQPRTADVLARMSGAWAQPDLVRGLLPATTLDAVDAYSDAVREEASRWRADYFETREATVGPREMATFVLVFQWNRAGLSKPQQDLLSAVLAERPGGAS